MRIITISKGLFILRGKENRGRGRKMAYFVAAFFQHCFSTKFQKAFFAKQFFFHQTLRNELSFFITETSTFRLKTNFIQVMQLIS